MIGCDVGSQGTNAALYGADGTLVASAYEAYDVAFPHPGWAEQDPRLWTAALHAAIGRLLAEVPEGPSAVKGLSFGSQLDGMVVCDRRGEPLRPAMIWMDRRAEPQAAALARQSIDGVVGVSSRRTTAWVGSGELGGFARGLEVELELDETKFVGNSGFLFASVLERFFGLYASVNSFTRLVARFKQQDGELKRWPPRAGDRPVG